MQNLINTLVAQGIPAKTAERMVKSLQDKPKKETKKRGFFPGMSTAKRKQPTEIELTIVCECCGNTKTELKTIDAYPDSPTTQKVSTSVCEHCPDYFRELTHEQLVALAIARHHVGINHAYPRTTSQVKFAKKYSPEEIVTLQIK